MTKTQKYLLYGIPALAVLYLGYKAIKKSSNKDKGLKPNVNTKGVLPIDKDVVIEKFDDLNFDGKTDRLMSKTKYVPKIKKYVDGRLVFVEPERVRSPIEIKRKQLAEKLLKWLNSNNNNLDYVLAIAKKETYVQKTANKKFNVIDEGNWTIDKDDQLRFLPVKYKKDLFNMSVLNRNTYWIVLDNGNMTNIDESKTNNEMQRVSEGVYSITLDPLDFSFQKVYIKPKLKPVTKPKPVTNYVNLRPNG